MDDLESHINWIARGLLLIFWIIILQDILSMEENKQKAFWILSKFLLPFFAPVVYLSEEKTYFI